VSFGSSSDRGLPNLVPRDKGSECSGGMTGHWTTNQAKFHFSRRRRSTNNTVFESFIGRIHEEYLDSLGFGSIREA
jgi:hypothetical protein